jgi:hypothetical protein
MRERTKRYTLKDFHDEAAQALGSLPHIETLHVETSWWYDANTKQSRGDVVFSVVVYTSCRNPETENDMENIRGEGPTPHLAIEQTLYSYRSAFGKTASAVIDL